MWGKSQWRTKCAKEPSTPLLKPPISGACASATGSNHKIEQRCKLRSNSKPIEIPEWVSLSSLIFESDLLVWGMIANNQ